MLPYWDIRKHVAALTLIVMYSLSPERVPRTSTVSIDQAKVRPLQEQIGQRVAALGAVLIAHYYTSAAVQDVAEETGGCVSDSLEMARFGHAHEATTLIVAGVRFMGETAKILSPGKTVLMPATEATCSLDIGCPADEFAAFCDAHPGRTVVVYANTSAAVKARSDWVVTSSIALDVVSWLRARGEKILWAPDRHLGSYIQRQTGADMLLWQGSCVVHEEFKAAGVRDLKSVYPDAAVIAHPEAPEAVLELADAIGSTTAMIKSAEALPNRVLIVATDRGLFHKIRQAVPEKVLIAAPTAGEGANCHSCAHCPWMAMNDLEIIARTLQDPQLMAECEIRVEEDIRLKALRPLARMLDFREGQLAVAS